MAAILAAGAMIALTKAMETLTNAMKGGFEFFKGAMEFGDKVQKASLALGQTYTTTSNQLAGSMQGLRGSMDQQMRAAIMGMEAGLQGNTAGIARLINQQQLTGTAFAKTAAGFAVMETSLGLSRDQTNRLADSLPELGAEFQVSTDKLVTGMMALKQSFGAMNMAGMGDQVTGAMAQLTAELPAMGPQLQKVMGMVMDTSMDGYQKLTMLGMGKLREQLAAAKTTEEATQILKAAMVEGASRTKALAGDVGKNFYMAGVAQEVLGNASLDLVMIAEQFGQRVGKKGEEELDFAKQLSVLKSEIFAPLTKAIADKLYPIILKSADALSAMGVKLAKVFGKIIKSIPHLDTIFKKLTLTVIDWVIKGLNFAGRIFADMKRLFNENIKEPLKSLKIVIDIVLSPFRMVGSVVYALMSVFASLEYALTMVMKGLFMMLDEIPLMGSWTTEINAATKAADMWARKANEWGEESGRLALESVGLGHLMDKRQDERIEGLGDKLLGGIRDDFAKDRPIRREQNEYLQEIRENTDPTNVEQPEYLDATANMIGRSMERILGFGPAEDLQSERVEQGSESNNLLRELVEQGADGKGPTATTS